MGGATLLTLEQIIALPDALGRHACECSYPEMRRLRDGAFHCPAGGAEILPINAGLRPFVTTDVCPGVPDYIPGDYGISPLRATSSLPAELLSRRSSVMSKVWRFRASGGTLSNILVSPRPSLVNDPA